MRYSRTTADPGGSDTAGEASGDAAAPGSGCTVPASRRAVHSVETFARVVDVRRTNKERVRIRQSRGPDTVKLLFPLSARMLGGASETCGMTPDNCSVFRVLLDPIRSLVIRTKQEHDRSIPPGGAASLKRILRMNASDRKIADVLARFGEPMAGNVWRVQGTAVIYHKALERIAAQAQIQFDPPTLVRAERDEAVILVTGRMGDRVEWSIGEALVGANYRVSGKQAAYVYAMAEKRAKDRVILKLVELHGLVYSEEEADEFRQSRPNQGEAEAEPTETAVEVSQSASEIETD